LKFYKKKKVYYFYFIMCVHILRILSKKLLMNNFWGTYNDNSHIHVKWVLTMFWLENVSPNTRFWPMCFKKLIKKLLLCKLCQCWWAKILLKHIWFCLHWTRVFYMCKVKVIFFWTSCLKPRFKFFVSKISFISGIRGLDL